MTNAQTPVEVDTKLAELYHAEAEVRSDVERINRYLTEAQVKEIKYGYWDCPYRVEDLTKAEAALKDIIEQQLPLEAAYEAGPWNRYWHVTNANGHIHRNQSCTSCFPDTTYAWRTDLSGLTEAEVVEREAYNACSVCMPIAPAEQKAAREYFNKQQREQRKAEKEAKADAKLAKKAERAIKFLAKVDAIVEKTYGGWDKLYAEYSLHGHDGKKSLYNSTFDLPAQVGNYLYDEMSVHEAPAGKAARYVARHMTDPKTIIAEATERGLI